MSDQSGNVPPPPPPGGYGPPPPGYGPPPPGYGSAPASSNSAVVALVCAIASFVVCPIILSIVALIFASKGSKEIAASGGTMGGAGMVKASKILAWINIVLAIIGIIIAVIIVIWAANNCVETNIDGRFVCN